MVRRALQDRKALYQRFLDEVLNQGKIEAMDVYLAVDFVDHARSNPSGDLEGARRAFTLVREGFPDARITIEATIAEGDCVAARCMLRGSNTGRFLGAAPTGRRIAVTGIDMVRFAGDKIAEHWVVG